MNVMQVFKKKVFAERNKCLVFFLVFLYQFWSQSLTLFWAAGSDEDEDKDIKGINTAR